jgi:hypothetical protein
VGLLHRPVATVAHIGVHQAYQIALALAEDDSLESFFCSLYDAPGKWGRIFSKMIGSDALLNRRVSGIPNNRICEYPWPFVIQRLRQRISPASVSDWFAASESFDRLVSRRLRDSHAEVFFGVETCSAYSLQIAKSRGMIAVLDCPQVHPRFLGAVLKEAADRCGLGGDPFVDTPRMAARKEMEFSTAEWFMV